MTAAHSDAQVTSDPREAGLGFRKLFDRHLGYVCHSLRRLGVREADLADKAQDAFVVVHRKLGEFDSSRPIRPWLFGICFRVASDYRCLARHRREVSTDTGRQFGRPGFGDEIATRDLVVRALGEIDLDRRAVLIMHDIEGHSMEEIGSTLGLAVGTGYTRLRIARRDFSLAVRRLQGTQEEQ